MTAKPRENGTPDLRRVKVHYTGRLEDGTVFDTSRDKEPLTVPFGRDRVIPGFEEALRDMAVGESKRVTIPPRKAYGRYREELVTEVDRRKFSADLELREGQHLQLKSPGGVVTKVQVKKLEGQKVTIDANHPLAGKTLVFDVEVLEIR